MSWDVLVMRLDRVAETIDDLPEDYLPLPIGSADSVRNALSSAFPGTDWTDPHWGIFEGPDFSLEFNLGTAATVDSFTVLVRGTGEPVEPLAQVCDANGWRGLDVQTNAFLRAGHTDQASWRRFCDWRDKALKARTPQ